MVKYLKISQKRNFYFDSDTLASGEIATAISPKIDTGRLFGRTTVAVRPEASVRVIFVKFKI